MMVDLTLRNALLHFVFALCSDDIRVVLRCVICQINARLFPALAQVRQDFVWPQQVLKSSKDGDAPASGVELGRTYVSW